MDGGDELRVEDVEAPLRPHLGEQRPRPEIADESERRIGTHRADVEQGAVGLLELESERLPRRDPALRGIRTDPAGHGTDEARHDIAARVLRAEAEHPGEDELGGELVGARDGVVGCLADAGDRAMGERDEGRLDGLDLRDEEEQAHGGGVPVEGGRIEGERGEQGAVVLGGDGVERDPCALGAADDGAGEADMTGGEVEERADGLLRQRPSGQPGRELGEIVDPLTEDRVEGPGSGRSASGDGGSPVCLRSCVRRTSAEAPRLTGAAGERRSSWVGALSKATFSRGRESAREAPG